MDQNQQENSSSLVLKHWSTVVILAIIATIVGWMLLNMSPIINNIKERLFATNIEKEAKRLEELYKNDVYGGKTPEETFDLFINALKKEDINLASRYFIIQKQESWFKTFEEYKNSNIIADFVIELENSKNTWEKSITKNPNVVNFYGSTLVEKDTKVNFNGQELTVPADTYTNITRFEKYPSGIWKISLL